MRKKNRVDKTGKKHRNDENKAGNGQVPFSGFFHDIAPVMKGRLSMGLKRGRSRTRPGPPGNSVDKSTCQSTPQAPEKRCVKSKVKVTIMINHFVFYFHDSLSIVKNTG